MTPTTRNLAIGAAALAAIPAIAALALGPDRARALPSRAAARIRDALPDGNVEDNVRRISARLDDLSDDIDGYFRGPSTAERMTPVAIALAILPAVAALVPKLLNSDMVPRGMRDTASSSLSDISARLAELDEKIAAQRDDAFDTVKKAADDAKS